MRKYGMICLVMGAALLWSPVPSRAGSRAEIIFVIVNKSVTLTSATRDNLRPIFQTKKDTWPDGTPARPFNLPPSNSARQGFDAAVLGLDPDRVTRYWIDRKIRGDERPPQTAPSDAVMLKIVSTTVGAIGYVAANAPDANIRVLGKIVAGEVVAP